MSLSRALLILLLCASAFIRRSVGSAVSLRIFFILALLGPGSLRETCSAAPLPLQLGEPEPLPRQLHAFNSNLLTATAFNGITYGGPEFAAGLRDLQPAGLRFPGGTTANNYLWQEDSFSIQDDDRTEWAAQQLALFRKIGRTYDLPGYARICREFDLTPIWVLNIYEETPESVVALLDHLDTLNLKLAAIEMGNEPYWDPRSLMNVYNYSQFCRPLAAAIRAHRPDLPIGACFGPLREDSPYAQKWNAPLAKQDWYDAIVYHEYYGGQGFALEAGVELPLDAILHPEALFDEPVAHFSELLPGKPIWFTEWNIGQKGLNQWKNTGAELLFLAAAAVRLMEQREHIQWSCFHQIYEAKFGTFFYDKESGRIETLPSYEFFRLLGALWSGAETFRPLTGPDSDAFRGFATEGNDGIRLLLLNRGPDALPLLLPDATGTDLTALTIDADPAANPPNPRASLAATSLQTSSPPVHPSASTSASPVPSSTAGSFPPPVAVPARAPVPVLPPSSPTTAMTSPHRVPHPGGPTAGTAAAPSATPPTTPPWSGTESTTTTTADSPEAATRGSASANLSPPADAPDTAPATPATTKPTIVSSSPPTPPPRMATTRSPIVFWKN